MKEGYEINELKSYEIKSQKVDYIAPEQLNEIDNKYDSVFAEELQVNNAQADVQSQKSGVSQNIEDYMDEKLKLDVKKKMQDRMEALKTILRDNDSQLLHAPERTALFEGYSAKFSSRVSDRERAKKLNNKRSRLYKKKQNAEMINTKAKDVATSNFALLNNVLPQEFADHRLAYKEEITDLASFMDTEDLKSNSELIKLYIGNGKERDKDDVRKSMDIMLSRILSDDVSTLRLDNDKVIADNAIRLEKLTNRVVAFDRLAEANGYFDGLDEKTKKEITEKLDGMRAIANYYSLKKQIINDPLYMKSYNEELSLDFTATDDPEKQELARKLLKAYVVGEDMMAKNGAKDLLKKGRIPSFADESKGNRFMREIENTIDLHHDDELLRENYTAIDAGTYGSEVLRKNKDANQLLAQSALDHVQAYKGEWYEQPGYEDKGYDEAKVKGYFDELDKIKVTDLKCSTFMSMITNMDYNYEIFEKVDRLWFEIARALDHGYKDKAVNDKKLMEIRAKCNTISDYRIVTDMVTRELVENPQSAAYTNEQWENVVGYSNKIKNKYRGIPAHNVHAGDPSKLLAEWMKEVTSEDADKAQSIQRVYPYVLGEDNEQKISSAELKKRKEEYNKNAFIQDYLFLGSKREACAKLSSVKSSLVEKEIEEKYKDESVEERSKRVVFDAPRMITSMIFDKSSAEVERLIKLFRGSQEEQMQFYTELLDEAFSLPLNDFQLKEGGSILDNMHKKNRIGNIVANVNNAGEVIKRLIERNPEKQFKLPRNFANADEAVKYTNVLYSTGCALISPHMQGYIQMPSTKYLHAFNVKELGCLDKATHDKVEKNCFDAELIPDDELFSDILKRMLIQLTTINGDNTYDPKGVFNLNTDIEEIFNRKLADYDKNNH